MTFAFLYLFFFFFNSQIACLIQRKRENWAPGILKSSTNWSNNLKGPPLNKSLIQMNSFCCKVLKAPFLTQVEGPYYNTMELRETISHSSPWIYALSPYFTDYEIAVNIIFSCHTIFMYIFMSVLSLKFKFCVYIYIYILLRNCKGNYPCQVLITQSCDVLILFSCCNSCRPAPFYCNKPSI